MDPKNRRLYTGRCGELAVMAELLPRGCRVVTPEVDVGKDLFVCGGANPSAKPVFTRVQVKTGNGSAKKTEGKYSVQIKVPLPQLKSPGDLYYIFAIRLQRRWVDFLILSRQRLDEMRLKDIGTETFDKSDGKEYLKLTFSFSKDGVTCSKQSFKDYRNAWHLLPPLAPPRTVAGVPRIVAPDAGRPLYTGAQLAVMSELLDRGCNVAMPELDKILAFQDEEVAVTEVQVQTGYAVVGEKGAGFTTQMDVPLEQLELPSDLYYVFAIRFTEQWVDFLILSRQRLDDLRVNQDIGSEYIDENTGKRFLKLTLSFSQESVTCSAQSFQDYRSAWHLLPPLRPE